MRHTVSASEHMAKDTAAALWGRGATLCLRCMHKMAPKTLQGDLQLHADDPAKRSSCIGWILPHDRIMILHPLLQGLSAFICWHAV